MKLIDTHNLKLVDINVRQPHYAILSHTWAEDEVSYQEMKSPDPTTHQKKGFEKILKACELAANNGFDYVWVDTCCIDKSSSAELSEAINSMYKWYRDAAVCYVYLSDLSPDASVPDEITRCRWFTRGWTLQELIAPYYVFFYNRSWVKVGSKQELMASISNVTKISESVLSGKTSPQKYPIATRMTWAGDRETSRPEDIAYCLLGLFDINMPLLYGEGEKAFKRLQEEIIKAHDDSTILLWNGEHAMASPLALHPSSFELMSGLDLLLPGWGYPDLAVTKRGLFVSNEVLMWVILDFRSNRKSEPAYYQIPLAIAQGHYPNNRVGVRLRKVGPKLYHYEGISFLPFSANEDVHMILASTKQFHIVKLMEGTDLRNRLKIYRDDVLRVPHNSTWTLQQTCPSDWWEWRDKLFLKQKLGFETPIGSLMALKYLGQFHQRKVLIIVLCIYEGGDYSATIIPILGNKTVHEILFYSSLTEEGISRYLLAAQLPQLLAPGTNRLQFEVGGRWYEVKATFVKRQYIDSQSPDEPSSGYELHLSTRELVSP